MRFVALCLLSACGTPGLTVIKNGHDISDAFIQKAFYYDSKNHYRIFTKVVNYLDLARQNGLQIEFVDKPLMVDGQSVRGVTYSDNTIQIAYPGPATDQANCMDTYYVLSHELLHFACANGAYGDCNKHNNHDHMVPYVFVEWGLKVESIANETIEYWSYFDFLNNECKKE